MVFEQIEKLKKEYTDKYVQVDGDRPELARFQDVVGQVRTVNMSGRALVEFGEYFENIGWYDIDLDYLKVVDKPAPKPAEAKPAKKAAPAAKKPASAAAAAAGEKKLSPLEMARMQGPAKKQPAGGGSPEPAKPAPAAGQKLSVADMLAAARAEKKAPAETVSAAEAPSAAPAVSEPAVEKPIEAAPAEQPAAETPAAPADKIDKSKMSIADMVAWCREHDG